MPSQHPPISQLEDHLGYWLRRVSNHVSHSFQKKLEAKGVTVAEWVVLRLLYGCKEAPPSLLAEQIGMSRGAVSKLAERLVQKSLVVRGYSSEDRRYQALALTRAGRSLVPVLAALADRNDAELFSILPPKQQNELMNILKTLAKHHQLETIPLE